MDNMTSFPPHGDLASSIAMKMWQNNHGDLQHSHPNALVSIVVHEETTWKHVFKWLERQIIITRNLFLCK